jgi:hypothetical protein
MFVEIRGFDPFLGLSLIESCQQAEKIIIDRPTNGTFPPRARPGAFWPNRNKIFLPNPFFAFLLVDLTGVCPSDQRIPHRLKILEPINLELDQTLHFVQPAWHHIKTISIGPQHPKPPHFQHKQTKFGQRISTQVKFF